MCEHVSSFAYPLSPGLSRNWTMWGDAIAAACLLFRVLCHPPLFMGGRCKKCGFAELKSNARAWAESSVSITGLKASEWFKDVWFSSFKCFSLQLFNIQVYLTHITMYFLTFWNQWFSPWCSLSAWHYLVYCSFTTAQVPCFLSLSLFPYSLPIPS